MKCWTTALLTWLILWAPPAKVDAAEPCELRVGWEPYAPYTFADQSGRATLDNITDGISLIDGELRLLAWNDRFIELFRFPPDLIREGVPMTEIHQTLPARGSASGRTRLDHVKRSRATTMVAEATGPQRFRCPLAALNRKQSATINTFAILRLDNGAELTTIQKVSKNAYTLKFAQGFVDRFLNIFPCVLNNLCG